MLKKTLRYSSPRIVLARHAGSLSPFDISYGRPCRMANSGITGTLFGSYGFLGVYIANQLGGIGTRVYAPYRGCELEPRMLKPLFDHGQLALLPFSTRDEESLIASMQHSDIVINCIGKHYETKHLVPTRRENGKLSRINFDFEEVNVTIPRKLAKLAKQLGVKTFVHFSALSADLDSSSKWSMTKAKGELAVREEFPEAIIIRQASMFGHEDRFLNSIAETIDSYGYFPLINEGSNLVQPVYVDDVAKATMKIIYNWKDYEGRTFQLAGPAEYSYREVVEFVCDVTTMKAELINIPKSIASLVSRYAENMINPAITADNIEQILEDNILLDKSDLLTFETLGLEPVPMDKIAFDYLHRFRRGGHFIKVKGYHTDLKV